LKIAHITLFVATLSPIAPWPAPAFNLDLDKLRNVGEKLKPLRQPSEGDEIAFATTSLPIF